MTQRRIYQDEYPYFITFRAREGYQLFEDTEIAGLLLKGIFMSARIKRYDVLAWQIMPEHVHLLMYIHQPDRTLEKVLSVGCKCHHITPERMLSSVRSHPNNNVRSRHQYTISDLI